MRARKAGVYGIAAGVLALAFLLRWPVPAPAWSHFDEAAFVVLPLGFWSGDLNPHYFNYPTLQFYLCSSLYYLYFLARSLGSAEPVADFIAWRYFVADSDLLAIARNLNTLMSVAAVAATAALGRLLYGPVAAGLAALFLTVLPLSVRFGHLATTDAPAVLWIVLTLWSAVSARQRGGTGHYLAAGAFAGLACATKYPAILVAIPALAAMAAGRPWRAARRAWVAPAAAAMAFAATSPYVFADWGLFWTHFSDMAQTHLLASSPSTLAPAPSTGLAAVGANFRHGVGVAGAAVCVAVLPYAVTRRHWQDLVLAAGVGAFGGLLLLAESTFTRYALPLAPFAALLMARGVTLAARGPGMLAALALVVAAEPAWASVRTWQLLSGDDTRERARRWIRQRAPDGARLIEPESQCGRIRLLTPDRVLVRQSHFIRSYELEELAGAYRRLSEREDLPPTYLTSGRGVAGQKVRVRTHHPVCPPDECEVPQRKATTFSPGDLAAAAFDRQDWYFLPSGGFGDVRETGPIITLEYEPDAGGRPLSSSDFFRGMAGVIEAHTAATRRRWSEAEESYDEATDAWRGSPEGVVGVEAAARIYQQRAAINTHLGQAQAARRYRALAGAFAARAKQR